MSAFSSIWSDIEKHLREGTLHTLTDEQLKRYLGFLATENMPNETVRHCALIRAAYINHIQMARILDAQERSNRITQRWFMVVAVGSILLSLVGLFLQFEDIRSKIAEIIQSTL